MRFDCSYDELLDVVAALRHRADVFDSLRTLAPEYWPVKHRALAERLLEQAAAQLVHRVAQSIASRSRTTTTP
jgi:hypothetical protein